MGYQLAVALAIGLLVGIERGWMRREAEEGQRTAGLRTIGLLGMLGGLAGLVGIEGGLIPASLMFVVVAGFLGPWQSLNPYVIRWMVVLVAGVSFVGYFAVHLAGARAGIAFTALFGGLASSTAVTLPQPLHRAGGSDGIAGTAFGTLRNSLYWQFSRLRLPGRTFPMMNSFRSSVSKTWFLSVLVCLAAPARAEWAVADAVRGYLEGLDAGAAPLIAGRLLERPEELSRIYRDRGHEPLWLAGAPLQAEVPAVLAAISESVGHGFAAERYHRSAIEQLLRVEQNDAQLALELLLTDAFLSQALHRSRGIVFPPNLDADWQVPQAEVDAVGLLAATAGQRGSVTEALAGLWPQAVEYALLLKRRGEILAMGDEMTAQVAQGPLLRPGDRNDRVLMLKQRLMGPGDYTPHYDEDLRVEVTAFQFAAGLEPDGIIGANTLEVLNASRVSWIDRIDANLERWRWLPRETPATYIRVNIAAYTLRAFENGEPTLSMNVIVGQPYRRTPVFTETIKYMVLNPYWNVPFSIATKDKLPLLQADAAAEAQKGYETRPHGSDAFIPVDAIDWAPVTRRGFNYLLRQKPGPQNALGRIKFMMPNPYAVYLHDTPSRELFARQERSFSSGCIRLEQPVALAEWILGREGHSRAGSVEALMARQQTVTINLKEPVPTYLVYFTAFATDDGDIAFRRDIYGRDRVLVDALRAQGS